MDRATHQLAAVGRGLILAVAFAMVASSAAYAAVTTDQPDYAPGSVVTISGDNSNGVGYTPGATISVSVSGPNGWASACTATVTGSGTWSCQVTLSSDPSIAVGPYTYTATSIGADGAPISESGAFTDGNAASVAGTVTDSVTHLAIAGATVTCTAGCNGSYSTSTNVSGLFVFDGSTTKLQFSGNGPATLTLTATKSGYTENTVTFTVAHNGDTLSGRDIALTPAVPADTTAPTISFSGPTPNGSNGWFKTAPATVTVTATDTDDGGVASLACTVDGSAVTLSGTGSTSTTRYGDVIASADGDHVVSCQAADSTGNTALYADNTTHLKLDATAPTITLVSRVPAANGAGWNSGAVTVTWSCTDATSGAVTSSVSQTVSTDGANQSATGTCTDNAGNTASNTQTGINIDTAAPTVIGTPDRSPDHNGWYNQPVTITWSTSGTDLSDNVTCDVPTVYAGPDSGTASATGHCTDAAGNIGSATLIFQYDATAPASLAVNADRGADHGAWYNHPFTATWTGTDATSGIASCTKTTYSGPDTASGSLGGICTDQAGNTSGSLVFPFQYDATAPINVMGAADRSADHSGWYNHAFTATWSGTDATSGIDSCTTTSWSGPDTSSGSLSGTCTDKAGNTSGSVAFPFQYDATAPTISADLTPVSPAATGWYNISTGAPTVSFTCSDATSGLAGACPDSHVFPDGADQSYSQTVFDAAGNSATAEVSGINVDVTAPTITASLSPASPAATGWYNIATGAPTVSFTCFDATSGLAGVCPASHLFADGAGQSYSQTVFDVAGNSSTAGVTDVSVDTAAPTGVAATANRDPDHDGWYNRGFGVTWSGQDATSTIDSCTSTTYSGSDTATGSLSGTCTDVAGNTSASVAFTFKYDATMPTITIMTPAAAASYVLNQAVAADYECADATSGIESCTGPVADGAALDTSSIGPRSFTVNAEDVAGNVSTASRTYSVKYAVCLLYDQAKSHKAGSTVPLKFYLCDANGIDVSSSGAVVTATALVRKDTSAAGVLDDSGSANPDNNFRYDGTLGPSGGYIFNLSTKYPSPALGQKSALGTGTWILSFTVNGVGGYALQFDVK